MWLQARNLAMTDHARDKQARGKHRHRHGNRRIPLSRIDEVRHTSESKRQRENKHAAQIGPLALETRMKLNR